MRKKKLRKLLTVMLIISAVLLVIVSSYAVYLDRKVGDMSRKYSELENDFTNYKSSSDEQVNALNARISNITDENKMLVHRINITETLYNDQLSQYNELDSAHTKDTKKIDLLSGQMTEFEQQISDSLKWYKSNAVLSDSDGQKRVKNKLDFYCLKEDDSSCEVKLGCFWLVNQEFLGLRYKYDILSVDKWDKILSIKEFLDNGGGDCEDYALFFKAQLNYILDRCENKDITLQGWWYSDKEKYWADYQEHWYIPNADVREESNYIYPNIICGKVYDYRSDDYAGHCVIALTKSRIKDGSDLGLLMHSKIIEPQDGEYLGDVNKQYLFMPEYNGYAENLSISMVITDNDLYLFDFDNEKWLSYALFRDEINDIVNS